MYSQYKVHVLAVQGPCTLPHPPTKATLTAFPTQQKNIPSATKHAFNLHKTTEKRINIWWFVQEYVILQTENRINIHFMKTKKERLEYVRMILSEKEIGSQEELLVELRKVGHNVTQATLSRDMKKMKVTKQPTSLGGYCYKLPETSIVRRSPVPQTISEMMNGTGFLTLRVSGNIAVVRTKPGYASSIAYHIDTANIAGILGTIAGDDTIFLALDEAGDKETTVRRLGEILRPE
jgi:transcriptional regulator of arginine metabolism